MIRKDTILSFLEGHKRADELIVEEKKKRLTRLLGEDSSREYIALCELAEKGIRKGNWEILQKKKIEFLLKRRQFFNRAGRFRGGQ